MKRNAKRKRYIQFEPVDNEWFNDRPLEVILDPVSNDLFLMLGHLRDPSRKTVRWNLTTGNIREFTSQGSHPASPVRWDFTRRTESRNQKHGEEIRFGKTKPPVETVANTEAQ